MARYGNRGDTLLELRNAPFDDEKPLGQIRAFAECQIVWVYTQVMREAEAHREARALDVSRLELSDRAFRDAGFLRQSGNRNAAFLCIRGPGAGRATVERRSYQ